MREREREREKAKNLRPRQPLAQAGGERDSVFFLIMLELGAVHRQPRFKQLNKQTFENTRCPHSHKAHGTPDPIRLQEPRDSNIP